MAPQLNPSSPSELLDVLQSVRHFQISCLREEEARNGADDAEKSDNEEGSLL